MDYEEILLKLKKAVEMESWAIELYSNGAKNSFGKEAKKLFLQMKKASFSHSKRLQKQILLVEKKAKKQSASKEKDLFVAESGAKEEGEMLHYYEELSLAVEDSGLKKVLDSLCAEEKRHRELVLSLIEKISK